WEERAGVGAGAPPPRPPPGGGGGSRFLLPPPPGEGWGGGALRIPIRRFKNEQHLPLLHRLPFRKQPLPHPPRPRAPHLVLHLHRLEDHHHVARAHAVAGGDQPLDDLGLQGRAQFSHGADCAARPPGQNARMASLIPLVETYRGGTLECVHFGALAVADASGRVIAQAGDPFWTTFTRSTLKPLQALPF